MLSTKGTYIFSVLPSAYGSYGSNDSNKASRYLDVCGQLLGTAMDKNPIAFAGVPWISERFMRTCKQEMDGKRRQRIQDVIQTLKIFESGGAIECIE